MEAIVDVNNKNSRIGKTGLQIPQFGLGGGAFGNVFFAMSDTEAQQIIATAWEHGVRYFDTAPLYGYGLSERRLGDALRQHPRASYVLSTKVGRLLLPDSQPKTEDLFPQSLPFKVKYDYTYDGVMRSFEDSLQRIGTDYIDILFVHDLGRIVHGEQHEKFFQDFLAGGYRALAELRAAKNIGAIGFGVNEWEVCLEALPHIDLDCIMLAGRYTLLEQGALQTFFPECKRRTISGIAAGPYNSGILATGAAEGSFYNYKTADAAVLERVRAIDKICGDFGVALPLAAIHFPVMHEQVCTVVAGAHSPEQFLMTHAYLQWQVPAVLWAALKQNGLLDINAPVSMR
jgi:D-threo-aldose 1-dehydrogenase